MNIFPRFLGASFEALPTPVRDSHTGGARQSFAGEATVTRGPGLWPRLIAVVFRFPPAGRYPVTVVKQRARDTETWHRSFGPHRFRSVLTLSNGTMSERFAPFTFTLDLHVADGALRFPVATGRLGPLPLPALALPISEARETAEGDALRFDVRLLAPLTRRMIVHYQGTLRKTGDP
ncbi:MAG: DUF4166 domain-containing protein [Shimia sp.]